MKPLVIALSNAASLGLTPSELRRLVAENEIEVLHGARGRSLVRLADVEAALSKPKPSLARDVEKKLGRLGFVRRAG